VVARLDAATTHVAVEAGCRFRQDQLQQRFDRPGSHSHSPGWLVHTCSGLESRRHYQTAGILQWSRRNPEPRTRASMPGWAATGKCSVHI